ncbi:urate oxidase [Nocardioides luteus]|uniref:Uricase n=1 Tax=Nocardioides luteus TaxID=1844 RepID=A0ABQ5SWM1_9ACTN|nr:urate oxidase [Nocardioides luteus]MDR7309487.1 urate oxidase [Nocardioides luteus]GGR51559.1 uricase [Nocardioides luteus]GLJ67892.1 uricase [Nocardioides luteus]
MSITLGPNQHGKAEVRLVKVDRGTTGSGATSHTIHDLNVSTQLRGDFEAAFTDGDNVHVHATDTQKNVVYAKAKELGVTSPERFLLDLADHWSAQPWVTGSVMKAETYSWDRIPANEHSFVRRGQETRTAVVDRDGERTFVLSGLTDLVVLKSTGSEFHGFPRDRYTTLAETNDRILATSVTAWWRWATHPDDWDAAYDKVRAILLDTFAEVHSLALQQTIYEMGRAVMEAVDGIAEMRISCPNKHHFLVDLSPFDLQNDNEVFYAADRPYGLIEAALQRDGSTEPDAWVSVPGFA